MLFVKSACIVKVRPYIVRKEVGIYLVSTKLLIKTNHEYLFSQIVCKNVQLSILNILKITETYWNGLLRCN